MDGLNTKLQAIEDILGNAAFLVSKGGREREAHSEILKALTITLSLKQGIEQAPADQQANVAVEINKVQSRLQKWAKNPQQKNARILRAYLDLKKNGHKTITEEQLKAGLPKDVSFEKNFPQMKNIADKNHGKVFDQRGKIIHIWEPVAPYVTAFEKATSGRSD